MVWGLGASMIKLSRHQIRESERDSDGRWIIFEGGLQAS